MILFILNEKIIMLFLRLALAAGFIKTKFIELDK